LRIGVGGAPQVNVLFVDQFSVLGGAQQCLLDLLPAIEERGWNMRAAVPRGGPLVPLLRGSGMHVDGIPSGIYRCGRKSGGDALQYMVDVPRQTAAIAEVLRRSRTDLIYVNGPRMLAPVALAALGRVPIFFHAHHFVSQGSARFLEGLILRESGAMVATCCEAVAQPLQGWVARGRIRVIPNGTRDLGFAERRGGKRIGMIGRIAPEKGQAEFLRAASLLMADAPDARFVICGAPLFGDRAYHDRVLSLARDLPVEFVDWKEDVGAMMRELDILVIPSQQEGMPRVMLEAFSAGLPVVAFPVGGIPEAIEDQVTGFLTPGPSACALAAKLREVLESTPGRLQTVARRARRQWEQRYTLSDYRERITNLMAQCVPHAGHETAAPRRRRSATPP
jgi:glycosyltransferase involved in cell wall biosynthesis